MLLAAVSLFATLWTPAAMAETLEIDPPSAKMIVRTSSTATAAGGRRVNRPAGSKAALAPLLDLDERRKTAPAPEATRAERPWSIGLGAVMDVGTLPRAAVGPRLEVRFARGSMSASAGIALFAAQALEHEGTSPGRSELGAVELSFQGCYAVFGTQLELGPCAGLRGAFVSGKSLGISEPDETTAFRAAANLGAYARWLASERLVLSAGLDGLLSLSRPRFTVEGIGEVFTSGRSALQASVNLGYAF